MLTAAQNFTQRILPFNLRVELSLFYVQLYTYTRSAVQAYTKRRAAALSASARPAAARHCEAGVRHAGTADGAAQQASAVH